WADRRCRLRIRHAAGSRRRGARRGRRSALTAQPGHHAAQVRAYSLDEVLGVLAAEGEKAGAAGLVLDDPLAGEGAGADVLEDLLHVLAHVVIDHPRPASVVAVLGRV